MGNGLCEAGGGGGREETFKVARVKLISSTSGTHGDATCSSGAQ